MSNTTPNEDNDGGRTFTAPELIYALDDENDESENDHSFTGEGVTTPNEDDDDDHTFTALVLIYPSDNEDNNSE